MPVVPPPELFRIFAQQLLALALQEHATWREWLGEMPAFRARWQSTIDGITGFVLSRGMLYDEGGMLSIGVERPRLRPPAPHGAHRVGVIHVGVTLVCGRLPTLRSQGRSVWRLTRPQSCRRTVTGVWRPCRDRVLR